MTNEKINATVEEIMEYEALLDEVKGIVDGLKDNLKNEMAERKVESLSTDRYTVRWTEVLTSKFNGYDITLVQRLLQHSSAAITQRYIGIEPQRIEEAIEGHAQLL